MATLLSAEWVNGCLEKTWAHLGEDGRKKVTTEVVHDVEPSIEDAKFHAENVNTNSDFRFKANVSGVQLAETCRIECKVWGISFLECFQEVMQHKTDRAKKVWAMLTEGRDYAKLQAKHWK
jgi:hypothetical protein